ncbi:lipopolysaccharide biosynthesis protein [Catellatospora coxensis]
MAALRGPVDAALYTAATRFLVIGQLGGQALGQTVQHRFSGLLAQDKHDEANRLYQMTTTWLIALIWPFYLTWAIFGGQLMTVFGEGYTAGGDAGLVGVVLSLTMLVATACGMVSTVQEMAGHTGIAFFQTMLALVVNVVLNIVLIPPYGIVGAAAAWSAALLIKNLLPLVQLQRRHGLSPSAGAASSRWRPPSPATPPCHCWSVPCSATTRSSGSPRCSSRRSPMRR